jgi:ubiquinone/menaquinone biosynthesis C-methylase UbiE
MDFEHIRQRYAGKANQEWERLCSTPIMRIEYMVTTHVLNRYLPNTGLILDAGSGPGRYTVDLVHKGYRVVMFDLLREMLQLGQQKVAETKMQEMVMLVEGNIVTLPYKEKSFDAVICLGAPLSHITDSQARSNAVAEIARVVKQGGQVFLTGMTRLTSYRGAIFWLKQHPEFFEQIITTDYRACGIMDGSQVWYTFATGELEGMMECAGLQVIDRVGCEGLANHLPVENLEQIEADERYWPAWKEVLLDTCNEPSIIGISNHLLVVASKAADAG